MSRPPFDLSDPAFRGWLVSLNVALDDIDAIARDMLRPPRRRELGPAKHREMYEDGWDKLMSLLGRATEPPSAPSGGTPQH
ncbi:MAG: hypothetical protein QM820_15095 [Minicystis sp.]